MEQYETWRINNHDVEFFDDSHTYLVDGVIVPSVTTILKKKFGNKYSVVPKATLEKASQLGIQMHLAIQEYEEQGKDCELKELRNYKFLKKQYKWECLANEVPVILFLNTEPIACGRVDMIGSMDGQTGIFDFKRVSTLDKDYLALQLNLYRIAYCQSYGIVADFLRGIHLREDVRKFVTIPVNEQMTWQFLKEWMEGKDGKD